jgi:prepilin-type N-terminal cleavage/methylation domain-containing protein
MEKGFTLVEVIVSIAVFLLVIAAGIGIFISIVQHQRNILSALELFNQMSYVQEVMSKSIRMAARDTDDISGLNPCLMDDQGNSHQGQNYLLTRKVGEYYTGLKFLNGSDTDALLDKPACTEFYLDAVTHKLMEKKTYYPYVQIPDSEAVPLTSPKLIVNSARFAFGGCVGSICPAGDERETAYTDLQPKVTFAFNVQGQNFQTTLSQRNLNVK